MAAETSFLAWMNGTCRDAARKLWKVSVYIKNIVIECGCAIFGKHLKFSTMRCSKCNFMLIDAEVGLLPTFLATMKAVANATSCW